MVGVIQMNAVLMSVMVPSSLVNGHKGADCHSAAYPILSVIILGVILMSAVAPFCARLWATVMPSGILISILSLINIVLQF